jgi:penicillin-binding protein 1A
MLFDLLPGRYQSSIYRLWKFFMYCFIALILFFTAVNFNFLWLFGGMPSLKQLDNPQNDLATEIISSDGKSLGKFFYENRSPVEYNEISPNVMNALVATEDVRYSEHSGIDLRSWARVIGKLGRAGGGSTISQQLAKNLFKLREDEDYKGILHKIPVVSKLISKVKEWITAVKLERRFTKREIITMYLNTVDFSSNSFGIKSAAKTYFDKLPKDLSVDEAALLVGMVQSPTRFNPKLNPDKSINRRNIVLSQMRKAGFITQNESINLQSKALRLKYGVENQNSGLAAYFREYLKGHMKKWLNDNGYTNEDLYTGGFKIHVTIDSRMQAYAEEAMRQHMKEQQAKFDSRWVGRNPWVYLDDKTNTFKELPNFINDAVKRSWRYTQLQKELGDDETAIMRVMRKPVRMRVFSWRGERDTTLSPIDSIKHYKRFLNIGMMSMDPADGAIKAWVGGINFKYFKYDHVQQSTRQPGSTFKPFVYVTAVENGFSTCETIVDQPVTFGAADGISGSYTPKNAEGGYSGRSVTLRTALGQSINSISAFLIKNYKAESVINMARRLGISSELYNGPSLCLGVSDVSVYEMVRAYSSFANEGKLPEAYFVTHIEDKYGNEIKRFMPDNKEVLSKDVAYKMIHLMRGATSPGGTAMGLSRYGILEGNEVAAKTGTTSNYSDGWFMGATSNLVTGVWVGGDDRSIHFRSLADGQGARVAMPAWGLYMQKVYKDARLVGYRKGKFKKPDDLTIVGDCIYGSGEERIAIDSSQLYVPPKTTNSTNDEQL